MIPVNSNDIKDAFIHKIKYANEQLKNCFIGDNEQFDKAEKYLKVIQELYSQMIIALKDNKK